MTFLAQNDKISITDGNDVVFSTDSKMPCILGKISAVCAYTFASNYYDENYFKLATLDTDVVDFIIIKATSSADVATEDTFTFWSRGPNGGSLVGFDLTVPWSQPGQNCTTFSQGSMLLEYGVMGVYPTSQTCWQEEVVVPPEVEGGEPTIVMETVCAPTRVLSVGYYASRMFHIEYKPEWGNQLVGWFQQSARSGYGAIENPTTWTVSVEITYGRF